MSDEDQEPLHDLTGVITPRRAHAVLPLLLVEDDQPTADSLAGFLRLEHYAVVHATTGTAALKFLTEGVFSVVVLDLMLPPPDGCEVVRRMRARGDTTPVLMVSARQHVDDRVFGLEAGADDYLGKPFSLTELLARIRALTRRAEQALRLEMQGLAIDWIDRRVTWEGRQLPLTNREFEILGVLARQRGRPVSREQMAREVLGTSDLLQVDNLIEVNMARLRRKLEQAGCTIQITTVRGVGYRIGERRA